MIERIQSIISAIPCKEYRQLKPTNSIFCAEKRQRYLFDALWDEAKPAEQ